MPKVFGTEQDIINCMALDPQATTARLRELLDGRFAWFAVRKLKDGEEGQEDDTHRVMAQAGASGKDGQDGPEERWQYEWQEDPNAALFRIGLTVEKANNYLAQEG
jgi:hypothetical protein